MYTNFISIFFYVERVKKKKKERNPRGASQSPVLSISGFYDVFATVPYADAQLSPVRYRLGSAVCRGKLTKSARQRNNTE